MTAHECHLPAPRANYTHITCWRVLVWRIAADERGDPVWWTEWTETL